MGTFMNSLGANPAGSVSSGIAGQTPPQNDNDVLSLVNRLKDREMQDYKDKANFDSNLSLVQEQRFRNLYDPNKNNLNNRGTVMGGTTPSPFGAIDSPIKGNDPLSELSPEGKLEYGLKKNELDQKNKLGQEALDVRSAQEKLNQQKSDQINTSKQADLQRKIDESSSKLELAQQALNNKAANETDQLQARKDYQAAVEERHKAEMAMKQHQFDTINDQHEKQIKDMEAKLKSQENTETTIQMSPDGTKKTVTTKKGDAVNTPVKNADGTYTVTAPDGRKGTIPGDKLQDWMQNYHPGGGE